jgi:AcrR family transcriptional regulator
VLEAAADVFGEKGLRAASLSDVADRAGHTIGAVYSNFASKDDVFRALMVERLRLFAQASFADAVNPGLLRPHVDAAGSRHRSAIQKKHRRRARGNFGAMIKQLSKVNVFVEDQRTPPMTDPGHCANCGTPLPPGQPADSRYCARCTAAWRRGPAPRE